jgi:hypothetical protein
LLSSGWPVDKVDHAKLVVVKCRLTGDGGGVDATLVSFGQATVLIIGGIPDLASAPRRNPPSTASLCTNHLVVTLVFLGS